jgi:CheY-like chemotaxis protein
VARWDLPLGQAPAEERPITLNGFRVLVADDNSIVRDLFVAYLTECGATCVPAADGVEALAWLRTEKFDAVAIDLAMPRADGLTVARDIRADPSLRNLRVVGISAHAGTTEREQALRAGMDEFLVKPIEAAQLARALVPAAEVKIASPTLQRLRADAMRLFRKEANDQAARVVVAWQRREWDALRAAAHYLKNSAFVVEDEALAVACGALQTAAESQSETAAERALEQCRNALLKWSGPQSNFPAEDSSADFTSNSINN